MNNGTQAMGHENCYLQHKSGRVQLVCAHQWARVSKTDWNGVQIRVVQLVSELSLERNA